MEGLKKNVRGITLVALVVTIVILLILAGVSLNLVLGNNGIVKKAGEAGDKYSNASANEQEQLSTVEDDIDKMLGTYDPLKKLPTKTFAEAQSSLVTEKTKVVLTDGTVVIPEGFKISSESANTVAGGVVITDAATNGNEWVWIPVNSIAEYKRTAYSTNVATGTIDETTSSEQIKNNSSDSYYYTEAMPEDEKTSVEKYKGFYIGRYEAGDAESTAAKEMRTSNITTNTVTLKKGQAPYNYVTKTQAQSLAEGIKAKQGYQAKTKLCSSYAWDTAIAFMQKANSDYGNSSEEGNYKNQALSYTDITEASASKDNTTAKLVPTGQTTAVCNIYDMGGNCWEWTTELFSHASAPCTVRGGSYDNNYVGDPAGYRGLSSDNAYVTTSFRPTLFM